MLCDESGNHRHALSGFGLAGDVDALVCHPLEEWPLQVATLSYIVAISCRQNDCQRNVLDISNQVMLAPQLAPVGGIRPGPPTARTEALSTTARDLSIRSASRSLASNNS